MKDVVFLWFCRPLAPLLFVVLGVVWLSGAGPEQSGVAEELHGILATQQKAWNQGDLHRFMDAYWNDPKLTFSSGGRTTRGWQATLDRYLGKYPDRATMGTLTLDSLETVQLGTHVAMTLGNWKLERSQPARGNFSLVWKKIDGQWKIVHDHSSLLPDSD